jgi:hypothetical protein
MHGSRPNSGVRRRLFVAGVPHRRSHALAFVAALVVVVTSAAALVSPASAQVTTAAGASAQATAREQALAASVADVPTLNGASSADVANLAEIPAQMSCAQLAKTTAVGGQQIQIVKYQTASASAGSPSYCAVTGHINAYIGFEVLLPINTWRQRYLQVGCGGLCGSISIAPPQSTGYQPLADGDFVLAAEDDGHSGNSISWYSNPQQQVDFAYLSYHDVALVSKGLAQEFYGIAPKYSYFDGCSQGGNEALEEVQRYPTDFNGVLAGACGGNGPDTYDGLGAVVAWSEKHIAPQALVATQYAPSTSALPPPSSSSSDLTDAVPVLGAPATTAVVRQIKLFPYPELPAYNGYGDVNDAASYVGKVSKALQQPITWLGKFDTTKFWCSSQGLDCRETSGPW